MREPEGASKTLTGGAADVGAVANDRFALDRA